MASAKIIDRRKTVAITGPRAGQLETLITYQDESGNFFIVSIAKEPVTDEDIKAAIRKDIQERGDSVGKTFTL